MSLATLKPIALELAQHPNGFGQAELAKAARLAPGTAAYWTKACVKAGYIFQAQRKNEWPRYFDSAARAKAFEQHTLQAAVSHEAVARDAAAHLRDRTLGSNALALLCQVPPAYLDAALAPLVDAGKLMRINAFRNGAAEFDYRWSATWLPKPEDFAICRGGGAAPAPAISPVTAPAPGKLEARALPATRPAHVPRPVIPEDHARSGKSGAQSKATKQALDRAFAQPQSLGWAPASASASASGETKPAAHETKAATVEPKHGFRIEPPVPLELSVTDLVCALNSRGELVLNLGDETLIKFAPQQALVLSRFALASNTVLEQMAQRGEL